MDSPTRKPSALRHTLLTAAAVTAAVGLIILYSSVDPSANLYPRCGFRMLTGLSCPGCGSQRALHALLNGHWAEAVRFNALFIAEIPLIGLLLLSRLPGRHFSRMRRLLGARTFILLILATIIIWTVVRNIFDI